MVLLFKSSSQNSQILKNLCLNNFRLERQYFTPSIPVGNTDICRYANWFWGKRANNQMLNDVTDFFCHMLSPHNVKRTVNSKINAVKIAKLLLWLMKVRFCFFFVSQAMTVEISKYCPRMQTLISQCSCADLPFNNAASCFWKPIFSARYKTQVCSFSCWIGNGFPCWHPKRVAPGY